MADSSTQELAPTSGQRVSPANPFLPAPVVEGPVEKVEPDEILGDRVEQSGVQDASQFAEAPPRPSRETGPMTANSLWLVPAHGGAGASTAASLLGEGFVDGSEVEPMWMGRGIVVAQTHGNGLACARELILAHGRGEIPWTPVGILLIHDTPKLSEGRRRLAKTVAGMYPKAWTLPFVSSWREPGHEPMMEDLGVRGKLVAGRLKNISSESPQGKVKKNHRV